MEELKAQLSGKQTSTDRSMFSGSLSVCAVLHPSHSTGEICPTSVSSSSSNVSEPVDKAIHEFKISLKRTPTVQCLQSDELSSDSLEKPELKRTDSEASFNNDDSVFVSAPSSPFLLHENSSSSSDFEFIEAECAAQAAAEAEEQNLESSEENGFCILSPIIEKSEASSLSSNERPLGKLLSSSMHAVGAYQTHPPADAHLRSQTFPRVSHSRPVLISSEMYPLEPRELDPSCYQQLHAADSQEELQEFLLLESECLKIEGNRGLASAFTPPDSGEDEGSCDKL